MDFSLVIPCYNESGNLEKLIFELLGSQKGCTNGMGGSASIHSHEKNIFGHDGLMGSQVPIAVGHCYATRKPTIVFMGDASAEEGRDSYKDHC